MSLQYNWAGAIPEETGRVARAAFPKGSVAMQMRDLFGAFVSDRDLDLAYLIRGRPRAVAPTVYACGMRPWVNRSLCW